MIALKRVCVCTLLCIGILLEPTEGKPAKTEDESQRSQVIQPRPQPISVQWTEASESADKSHARRVVSSWNEDGIWQGSARLPSSSQTGGNEHSSTNKDLTNGRTIDTDTNTTRYNRRLQKWDKAEQELSDENEAEAEGDGTNLAQSLSAMTTHLLDKGDDSLENSSERDVYINKNEDSTASETDTDEILSDEDSDMQVQDNGLNVSPTTDSKSISTWHDDELTDEAKMIEKQKSDRSPTTPKGLTTWSEVNGGGSFPATSSASSTNFIKGTVQKLPSDFTVSGVLSFSTDRPSSTIDMIVTKDRSTFPTTEIPRTTKSNNVITPPTAVKKRKPYNKNKKVVAPSKFVKPQLEEVTAEAIGSDDTHTIYKTRVTEPQQSKTVPSLSTSNNNFYPTKKPAWPYQMTTKRIVTTRRPVPFSRITARPKLPTVKRPQMPGLTLTTPTTTTPPSTTVYHRNPGTPVMYPFPSISLTNLGFMDFLRSQIIPRIGLSLISFMAASPLILSMLGASAAVGRRHKRDTTVRMDDGNVFFKTNGNLHQFPKFDFSTIKKKLEKLELIRQKKNSPKQYLDKFSHFIDAIFESKPFFELKSKILNLTKDGERRNKDKIR